MCWAQAQSAYPFGGTPPNSLRPHGSEAHCSWPQFFNEKGGLAITQSNRANRPWSKYAGSRSMSPRSTWKSSMPCSSRFIRAIAEVVSTFSWPYSLPSTVFGSPPRALMCWMTSISMPPVPQAGS
ncbi:hypothetical protein STANM309S_06638 [Streptomyces tanashiensis]